MKQREMHIQTPSEQMGICVSSMYRAHEANFKPWEKQNTRASNTSVPHPQPLRNRVQLKG